ncbi:hypothetical protein PINS_up000186 [Pythium insidiosum]|nr:hypothetical protein PINS_up000186 [Pythium insidiosum]
MKQCPLDRVLSLRVASCTGDVRAIAEHHGLLNWKVRACVFLHLLPRVLVGVSLLYHHGQIHVHEDAVDEVYDPQELVYLSPDADDVLLEIDPRAVYVVGGIVDRSVRKGREPGKGDEPTPARAATAAAGASSCAQDRAQHR